MEYDEEDKVDGFTGVPPQSNMVLRKRIKRIRAGMKKYNTQLDEVKRYELHYFCTGPTILKIE